LLARLNEDFWESVASVNPLRRVAIPADIAKAILFLSSDLASYMTGNILALDGGTHFVAALPTIEPLR
jgi:3-oxoacyl-[acyl-carrier protein] reductase/7-alpha-hydroxysteroid dehydrogenase